MPACRPRSLCLSNGWRKCERSSVGGYLRTDFAERTSGLATLSGQGYGTGENELAFLRDHQTDASPRVITSELEDDSSRRVARIIGSAENDASAGLEQVPSAIEGGRF